MTKTKTRKNGAKTKTRIETDMTAPVKTDAPALYEEIITRTPVGRFGNPDECAGTANWVPVIESLNCGADGEAAQPAYRVARPTMG
jgi:NAD(P)-dependent dehydrogenase (short-subunit alcohol dehydrogenase family)